MNSRRFYLIAASLTAFYGGLAISSSAYAQEPAAETKDEAADRFSLFDAPEKPIAASSQSDVRRSQSSVDELRQARALYRANQRVARFEYNLWMGHEPLRPRWNAVPMMSSRYGNRRVYVPVYVYPR